MNRENNRKPTELRNISIETNVNKHAEGSALVSFGDTKVICTATIEHQVPRWMRNSDAGWVTAEYGMMPRSTNERMNREAARGKQGGRTLEIQRLIGRSLRQAVNPEYLKDKTITVDCDVIQADGGTRTASITGGCVALFLAIKNHLKDHRAIKDYVAAVSLGIVDGEILVDLDYNEDSNAETDMNIVMTGSDSLIEIQGTAEENPFSKDQLNDMIVLASTSIKSLIEIQKACLD
jgi:ribonuclease PH